MELFNEEFEFKPLTEGLGFHTKTVDLKKNIETSGAVKEKLATSLPLTPEALLNDTVNEKTEQKCRQQMMDFDDLIRSADELLDETLSHNPQTPPDDLFTDIADIPNLPPALETMPPTLETPTLETTPPTLETPTSKTKPPTSETSKTKPSQPPCCCRHHHEHLSNDGHGCCCRHHEHLSNDGHGFCCRKY